MTGAYSITTPALGASILGAAEFSRAWQIAPERLAKGLEDGVARAMLGFRKQFLETTPLKGFAKPRNRWIWIVRTSGRGDIDSIEGRLFPRKFHRSYLRLERGGSYAPREARYHAIAFRWNRTKSGRPKKGYASPDTFNRTFGANRKLVPVHGKGGRFMLVEFRRRGSKWREFRPAFLLVPRIQTPRRLQLQRIWRSPAARSEFLRRLNDSTRKTLDKIFGAGAAR